MKRTFLTSSRLAQIIGAACFAVTLSSSSCGGDDLKDELGKCKTEEERQKFLKEKLGYEAPGPVVQGPQGPTTDTLKVFKGKLAGAKDNAAKVRLIKDDLGVTVTIGSVQGHTDEEIVQAALKAKFPKSSHASLYDGEKLDLVKVEAELTTGRTAAAALPAAQTGAANFTRLNNGITSVATRGTTASANFATEWDAVKAATDDTGTLAALKAFDTKAQADKEAIVEGWLLGLAPSLDGLRAASKAAYLPAVTELLAGKKKVVYAANAAAVNQPDAGKAIANAIRGAVGNNAKFDKDNFVIYKENTNDAVLYHLEKDVYTTGHADQLGVTSGADIGNSNNGADLLKTVNSADGTLGAAVKIVTAA